MQRYMRGMSNGGAIYARPGEVLQLDEIHARVPAVFQTEAHESRSARFAPVSTAMVLEGMMKEGFAPVMAQQARTRVEGKQEYTKHLVRLRHGDMRNTRGDAFEVILVNANDGTSAYQMLPGFFRMVCANGLVTGETFESVKVRHSGDAVGDVIEGAYRVLDDAPRVTEMVDGFKSLGLSERERLAFAEAAHTLRFPAAHIPAGTDGHRPAPITAERLLEGLGSRCRRPDDRGEDLWRTLNVVQEAVIRGGQLGVTRDANGRRRRASVRAVTGIDQGRDLNRALWTLAERMAELKAAA